MTLAPIWPAEMDSTFVKRETISAGDRSVAGWHAGASNGRETRIDKNLAADNHENAEPLRVAVSRTRDSVELAALQRRTW